MYVGAFSGCKWCHGRGCVSCDAEREKAFSKMPKPIFVATTPADIDLLKDAIGAKVIEEIYEHNGDDDYAINYQITKNLLRANVLQAVRKMREQRDAASESTKTEE